MDSSKIEPSKLGPPDILIKEIWGKSNKTNLLKIYESFEIIDTIATLVSSGASILHTGSQTRPDLMAYTRSDILNYAVTIYSFMWLCSDRSLVKNLHDFAKNGYKNGDNENSKDPVIVEEEYQRLRAAAVKCKGIQVAATEIYSQVYPEISQKPQTSDCTASNKRINYHYRDLWIIKYISDSPWNFYTLYFMRKKMLQTTPRKKYTSSVTTPQRDYSLSLSNAYRDLLLLFDEILPHQSGQKHPFSSLDDREYVVSSMMLYILESSGHFLFSAALAQYMESNLIPPKFKNYYEKLHLFYHSIKEIENDPDFPADKIQKPILPLTPYLIFPPNLKLCYFFEDSIEANLYIQHYRLFLQYLRLLLLLGLHFMPLGQLPAWSDKDFNDTRFFLEGNFWKRDLLAHFQNKINNRENLDGRLIGNGTAQSEIKCQQYIRAFYEFINDIDVAETFHDSPPREIVKNQFTSRKSKNAPS